jgi:hypothetical protein
MFKKTLILALSVISILDLSAGNTIINNTESSETVNDSGSTVNTGINLGGNTVFIKGNGKIISGSRELAEFNAISIKGQFEVKISSGDKNLIDLKAESNILPLISTEIKNQTLQISISKPVSLTSTPQLSICCGKSPQIISFSGNGKIDAVLNSENFQLISVGAIETTLKGKTPGLEIEMIGAGKLNAKNLKAATLDISMKGASSATVSVSKKLNADIIGAAKLIYFGSPSKITKKIIGGQLIPGK